MSTSGSMLFRVDLPHDAQDIELVTLLLKFSPFLGEIHSQPGRNALSLQLLGHRAFELGLEGANLLLRIIALLVVLVALSESLVTLPMSHTMF